MADLTLTAGGCRLVVAPDRGGSVSRFDWKDQPIFRPTCGPSPLDTACFPLVPFSNRIAHGRFQHDEGMVQLAPNFPGTDHPHTIHGFGWLAAWDVVEEKDASAVLQHRYAGGEWPWPYIAEQSFSLGPRTLVHRLSVTNLADSAMPAGLGLHPYFARNHGAIYHGLHVAEWQTAADGLPIYPITADVPCDWWGSRPVDQRAVDTVYAGRVGALTIVWPGNGIRLTIEPSNELPCTVVYTPRGQDYFCVEPVSHATDAINRPADGSGMRWLGPNERFDVSVKYSIED